MRECILDSLIITKCMEEESLHGQMADNMKGNISKTRNKVKVFIHGQMGVSTMENG